MSPSEVVAELLENALPIYRERCVVVFGDLFDNEPARHHFPVGVGEKPLRSFRKRMRSPDVDLPAWVVLFWQGRREQDASQALGTN